MSAPRDIAKALGGDLHADYALVPGPGHSARDRSVKVWTGPDGLPRVQSYAGQSWQEIRRAWERDGLLPEWKPERPAHRERPPRRDDNDQRRGAVASILGDSVEAEGTDSASYLRDARGLPLATIPADLRHHPALMHPHVRLKFSALVAIVRGPAGDVTGIQRIYLKPGGAGKADVSAAKLSLGQIKSGAVRLGEPLDGALAVTEGVESALALTCMSGAPAWALLGVSNFVNFAPPPGVSRIVLAPDGDDAGRKAIEPAARRLIDMGLTVDVASAPDGCDWANLIEAWAERSAIAEYDGGASRAEAEALARDEVFGGAT